MSYSNEPLSKSKKALSTAISAVCAGVPLAHAQDANQLSPDDRVGLEEVIVTASKRGAMNMQDVPISITAFTGETITAQGLKKLDDYFGQIPSLTFGKLEPGGTNVIMRGCAISGFAFGNNPTTGVYFDEQPITNSGFNPDPRLVDIERVEALAGPQGTTFGDASQCGTLRIITNKPVLGESSSWLDVTGAAVHHGSLGYEIDAMMNVPLGDTVAMRLVGFSAFDAGYVDNILGLSPGETFDNADQVDANVNGSDVFGGRAAILWQPSETLDINFQGTFQDTTTNGFGDTDVAEDYWEGRDIHKWQQYRFNPETFHDKWYQLALTLDKDMGWGVFTVTGSYFDRDTSQRTDATTYMQGFQGIANYTGNTQYDWGGDPKAATYAYGTDKRSTIEARLATSDELSSRWSFLVGAFYNKSKSPTSPFVSNVAGQSANCSAYYAAAPGCSRAFTYLSYLSYAYFGVFAKPSDNWWTGIYTNEWTSKALFGEFTFNVTENFSLTVGGRWYDIDTDRTLVQGVLMDPSGTDLSPNCATDEVIAAWQEDGIPQPGYAICLADFSSSSSETGFVPKFNATWNWSDENMIYFTYSEGFRNGGANGGRRGSVFASGGEFDEYDSDELANYEFGTKNTLFDGRVQANVTFYHMEWENIQIQTEDPDPIIFATGILNFPNADINGVEANFVWQATDAFNLNGTLGYNHATMAEDAVLWPDTDNELVIPDGTRLPLMPEWKFSLSGRYDFTGQLWNATPFVLGTVTYNGDSLNSLGVGSSIIQEPPQTSPSYTIFNFRMGLEGDGWSAAFFIDNVFNEFAVMFLNERQTQTRATVLPPRIIGINFRKDFDW